MHIFFYQVGFMNLTKSYLLLFRMAIFFSVCLKESRFSSIKSSSFRIKGEELEQGHEKVSKPNPERFVCGIKLDVLVTEECTQSSICS